LGIDSLQTGLKDLYCVPSQLGVWRHRVHTAAVTQPQEKIFCNCNYFRRVVSKVVVFYDTLILRRIQNEA
jgi:hypothetical protein